MNVRAIRELLERDPVALAIVGYLSRHPQAMDTAPGIAQWWIRRELPATQAALAKLLDLGVIQCRSNGPTGIYSYTRDPHLQQWLVHYVAIWTKRKASAAAPSGGDPPC